MARSTDSRETTPAKPAWRRYVLIAAPFVVIVAGAWFFFGPQVRVRGWINRLNTSSPDVFVEMKEALEAYEDRELVNRLLVEAVEDDDRSFRVREACARLLVKRQRLGQLDLALRGGTVLTRGVILAALSREPFFRSTYLDDASFRARETVREWLGRAGDVTRSHAIQLAMVMKMDDVAPLIRPIIGEDTPPNVHPEARRLLLRAAAQAVEEFRDCESVPRLAELAESDPDARVRIKCLEYAYRAAFRPAPPAVCAGAIEPERMRALATRALDDPDHAVRMKAIMILGEQREWASSAAQRLQAILDGDGGEPERRQALDTLVKLAQPAFQERLPEYLLDRGVYVRTTAMRAAGGSADQPWLGCLIGLLQAERPEALERGRDDADAGARAKASRRLFRDALHDLKDAAGSWVGFSQRLSLRASQDPGAFQQDLDALYAGGEVEGHTRQTLAEAWFAWWCDRLQLTAEQKESAAAARVAFWAARASGDVAGARAALDGLAFDVPGLFAYERAWLRRQAR